MSDLVTAESKDGKENQGDDQLEFEFRYAGIIQAVGFIHGGWIRN